MYEPTEFELALEQAIMRCAKKEYENEMIQEILLIANTAKWQDMSKDAWEFSCEQNDVQEYLQSLSN